jgi:hypothetical protein
MRVEQVMFRSGPVRCAGDLYLPAVAPASPTSRPVRMWTRADRRLGHSTAAGVAIVAAEALGARRFLPQSFILGYGYRDHGAQVLTEQAPFGRPVGSRCDPHVAAMRAIEQQAFSARWSPRASGSPEPRVLIHKELPCPSRGPSGAGTRPA